MEVNETNVLECWKFYEKYKEEFRKENYSDASYEEFEKWCKENLCQCPNCESIFLKNEQFHLNCIEELDYGK